MKTFKAIAIVCLTILSMVSTAQTSKEKKIMNDASKAKNQILKVDSKLERFFSTSAGYVIFPNVGKGAFIVGAASGNGVLYEKRKAKGMVGLKKLNIGLQAGGESIIEVIFFENNTSLKEFQEGNFAFSADASAVAIKSGVAVNAKYKDGVAVFALPKAGLMASASVGGQKFSYKPF